MDQYAQVLLDTMPAQLDTLSTEQRALVLESLLNGYVRVALKYQTPAEVAATLRSVLETISGK